MNWVIRPTQVNIPMQPSEVNSRNLLDGRISVSFHTYAATQITRLQDEEEVLSDEEQLRSHTIAVLIEYDHRALLVLQDLYQ